MALWEQIQAGQGDPEEQPRVVYHLGGSQALEISFVKPVSKPNFIRGRNANERSAIFTL